MTIQQICTFLLNGTRFGIEVEAVQEIVRQRPLARVPLAAPDICGLMNLRGQVIPVIDLPYRLALRAATCGIDQEAAYNIIVRTTDDVVSFIVDEIGDVLECDMETLAPSPTTFNAHLRSLIKGTYKLEQDFLLVLNTQKVLVQHSSGETHDF
jgi:purine-binding chemotaxis protein CheW